MPMYIEGAIRVILFDETTGLMKLSPRRSKDYDARCRRPFWANYAKHTDTTSGEWVVASRKYLLLFFIILGFLQHGT